MSQLPEGKLLINLDLFFPAEVEERQKRNGYRDNISGYVNALQQAEVEGFKFRKIHCD